MKLIPYVAGFLFNQDMSRVVLIEKCRPEFMKGTWNGVGGKIEDGETSIQALNREFEEETGLNTSDVNWFMICTLFGGGWETDFFYGCSSRINEVQTMTDEIVVTCRVDDVWSLPSLPNLKWLMGLALDRNIRLPLIISEDQYVNS